ncbi:UNVERIFIED_CONTAM: Retrovirus-related Pol polyprotein from transposon [Sesamum calycinum]|uniref:Retrovirus-related Pol polyprotein from transposon n=1 Tax=Sesamum calycinum TaxID=2727403 RepID=A0AAW2J1I6_9LAMI
MASNFVLVPKPGGKWRMCIDFWDLNKACPKDFYPLFRIDQLLDSTFGCELLSMMDASQGYYQIMLAPKDHKASLPNGTFCYLAMPFGLKNVGATYQRLVDKMFRPQLGKNMKAQALADFVSEMTGTTQAEVPEERPWLLHVDGSSTAQGSGAGVVITSPQGEDMEFSIKFDFKTSNNEAEYEALVLGEWRVGSQGRQHDTIPPAYRGVKDKVLELPATKIPRKENNKADSLSKLASAVEDCRTRHITVQHLPQP